MSTNTNISVKMRGHLVCGYITVGKDPKPWVVRLIPWVPVPAPQRTDLKIGKWT